MIPLPDKLILCPHCQQPYKTLVPIGSQPAPVNGQQHVTVEKVMPNTPTGPVRTGFLDLFTPLEQLKQQVAPLPDVPQRATTPQLVGTLAQKPKIPQCRTNVHDPYDNPVIGGRVTICILMYGDFYDLHTRCLNAIISTVPVTRRQIRVATNEVCPATLKYLSRLQDDGQVHKVCVNQVNIKKYPAMRQLFHDPKDPIQDKWVIWFDDDSIADRDPLWCNKLLTTIASCYSEGYRIFGDNRIFTLIPSQMTWIRNRSWYHGRPFQLKNGKEAPNGNHIIFPAGGFWALSSDCIKVADIPDREIGHNGGDYMVGEQVWQAGFKAKGWNNRKQFVHTSSVKRRGLIELHTGTDGWKPGGVAQ